MKAASTPPYLVGAAVPATSTSCTSQTHVEEVSGQKSDRVFSIAFSESQACRSHAAYPSTRCTVHGRARAAESEDVRQAGTNDDVLLRKPAA